MKVMYFAFEGFDTLNGTNHLALKIIDTFLKENHKVYLLSSHSTGINADIPKILEKREGFSYDIVQRRKVSKTNFISRYLDGFTYALKGMRKWKKVHDLDIVILQSTPTVFFSAVSLKLFLKKPIIFNSYDVFPNGPFLMGVIKNRIIYSILLSMQKVVYNCSSYIVVISEDMKKTFINMGINPKKLILIPNWYDDEKVKVIPKINNQFIQKYNIDTSKFYIQYAGNFGFTFDYKLIIDIALKLQNHNNIIFQMIGSGGLESEFKQAVNDAKINNIEFYPWQPSSIISDVYNAATIELIPLSKGVIFNSYPSKTSLLMACKKTFICITEKNSEFYKEINNNNIGFCFDYSETDKIIDCIINIAKNENILFDYEQSAYEYGKKYFSSQQNVIKYVTLCKQLKENRNE